MPWEPGALRKLHLAPNSLALVASPAMLPARRAGDRSPQQDHHHPIDCGDMQRWVQF